MTALTDAQLFIPFKTTLVPTNGSGNPTFTRATTKTVEDNEGKVKTLKSGAVGLAGARVIQNLITALSSEDISLASWTKLNCTTPSASLLVCSATTSAQLITPAAAWLSLLGGVYVSQWRVQYVDIQYIQILGTTSAYSTGQYCNFDLINGDYTATGCTATIDAVSAGVWDITVTFTATAGGASIAHYLYLVPSQSATRGQAFVGDGIKSIGILRHQIEDVTGKAIQTAGEYVSVGVLSAPYHGAGTDGVKYFDTDSSGVAIPDATMLGAELDPTSVTNSMLHCRDLTNAAWVKTNCTAAKTQTGVDGLANACSLLTFTADNGTCFQTITTASTPACTGWKIKRATGTGSIYITRDGGAAYTDVTSLINSGTFTLTGIENTSVLNPVVGFKGATASDAIIVDSGRNHSGTELCEDIFTTTAAVTRAAESLTYQTSGNFSDTAGTILATVKRNNWANGNGSVVGKASFGLLTSASNSGVQAADGTNTVSGAAGTPTGQRKIGARWSGSSLQAFSVNPTLVYTNGTAGSYDGSFNLATIAVMPGTNGYIRDLAIFNSSLADAAIIDAWDLAIIYALTCDVGSYSYTGIDATFLLARNLACDTGSYAYNGLDMTLNLARNLACDPGAYAYTGISAALTIITPARLITVNYNTPGIIVDYNTINIEVDA